MSGNTERPVGLGLWPQSFLGKAILVYAAFALARPFVEAGSLRGGLDALGGADAVSAFCAVAAGVLLPAAVHEAAHAWAALRLGDDTAKRRGRLTLNPFAHVDPVGTIMLPLGLAVAGSPVVIGALAPVPVDFERLRKGRWGAALVAAAGPGSNFAFAGVLVAALAVAGTSPFENAPDAGFWTLFAFAALKVNLALGLFNLIPIYPFDGGRIAVAFAPERVRDWFQRNESKIALGVFAAIIGGLSAWAILA